MFFVQSEQGDVVGDADAGNERIWIFAADVAAFRSNGRILN